MTLIFSAEPSRPTDGLGGLGGLVHLRAILGIINVPVLPDQLAMPRAFEAFYSDGSLKDVKQQICARRPGVQLAETLHKLPRD